MVEISTCSATDTFGTHWAIHLGVFVNFSSYAAIPDIRIQSSAVCFPSRRDEFQRTHSLCDVDSLALFKLALLLGGLLLLAEGPLARTRDLSGRRQARLGESLLLRQIFIFNQGLVTVRSKLVAEEVLYQFDLIANTFQGDSLVWRRWLKDQATTDGRALVLCLVSVVHAVLQQVQWYAERFKAKFIGEAQFPEAEEIFAQVFSEVSSDELFTAIIEGADTISTSMIAQGRSLLYWLARANEVATL